MDLQQTGFRFLRLCFVICLGVTAVFGTVYALQAAPPAETDATPPDEYFISALDATKTEGSDDDVMFTFLLTRTGSLNSGYETVDFTVTSVPNVPAAQTVDPDDFGGLFPSGTFSLPRDTRTYTLTITVSADQTAEFDEQFQVNLTNLSAGNLIEPTAVGTIQNDDDFYQFLPLVTH